MEIPDECDLEIDEVPEWGSRFVDEGSMSDLSLPKGVGSMPHNVGSGQSSNASFS